MAEKTRLSYTVARSQPAEFRLTGGELQILMNSLISTDLTGSYCRIECGGRAAKDDFSSDGYVLMLHLMFDATKGQLAVADRMEKKGYLRLVSGGRYGWGPDKNKRVFRVSDDLKDILGQIAVSIVGRISRHDSLLIWQFALLLGYRMQPNGSVTDEDGERCDLQWQPISQRVSVLDIPSNLIKIADYEARRELMEDN